MANSAWSQPITDFVNGVPTVIGYVDQSGNSHFNGRGQGVQGGASMPAPVDDSDALLQAYTKQPPGAAPPAPSVPASVAPDDAGDDLLRAYTKAAPQPTVRFVSPEAAKAIAVNKGKPLANTPGGDDILTGTGKNVLTGAIKGVADVAGLPGTIGQGADWLLDRGQSLLTGRPYEDVQSENALRADAVRRHEASDWGSLGPLGRAIGGIPDPSRLPTGPQIAAPILTRTGEYQPETEVGRMAQSGVENAVGALGFGARVPGALSATNAIAAPFAAGAAGQYGADASGNPYVGMLASMVPGISASAMRVGAIRAVGTVDPETATLATLARDRYGIPVNAGQISENPGVRFAGSVANRIPFSGAEHDVATQRSSFNRAVSQTFGENADKITPGVMQAARARLGNEFDAVASGTTIRVDQPFTADLQRVMTDAASVITPPELVPLNRQIQNVINTVDRSTNTISGQSYQALTRKGTPLDRVMNSSNPNVAYYGGQIRDALDDAMQRSAPPDLAARLSAARRQYKAMKTVEDLASESTTGDISPAKLMAKVRKSYGSMAYTGASDLGNLARIGQRFLKEPPSSGTSERLHAMDMFARVGGLAGGMFGLHEAGLLPHVTPENMLASAVAIPSSLLAGKGAGAALRSNWLTNAMLNRSQGLPTQPGLSNALVGGALPYFARGRNALVEAPQP